MDCYLLIRWLLFFLLPLKLKTYVKHHLVLLLYLPDIKVGVQSLLLGSVPATNVIASALIGDQLSMRLDHDGVEVFNALDLMTVKTK